MSEYTVQDYNELHQYVLEYQQGKPNSADNIIESFKSFLLNYVNFITYATYKPNDYSLKKFICLYTKKGLINTNSNDGFKEQMNDTSKKIQTMFLKYNQNEIKNELVATLLMMAKKYKDYSRPSFHNYVDKCFHYEAYRSLQVLIKDPISRNSNDEYLDNIYIIDECYRDFENAIVEINYQLSLKKVLPDGISKNVSPFDLEALDINWINGITCNEIFDCLTPFERIIIKAHYIDRETDKNISDKYGLCRATINRKRLKARDKLAIKLKSGV